MMGDMNVSKIPWPTSLPICEICIERQQLKPTFSNDRGRQTNKPLVITHSEVFGRIRDVL